MIRFTGSARGLPHNHMPSPLSGKVEHQETFFILKMHDTFAESPSPVDIRMSTEEMLSSKQGSSTIHGLHAFQSLHWLHAVVESRYTFASLSIIILYRPSMRTRLHIHSKRLAILPSPRSWRQERLCETTKECFPGRWPGSQRLVLSTT